MKASHKLIGGLLSTVVVFAACHASAQNLIQNPGFETGTLIDWTVVGSGSGVGFSAQTFGNGPSAPGSCLALMSNLVSSSTLSLEQSTPTASVVPGLVNYSFDLRNLFAADGGTFSIQISDLNSSGGVIDQGPGLLQPNVPIDGNWHTISGSFTAPANVDHLKIQFDFTAVTALWIDNVSLSQVPEPTTVTLTGLGVVGLLAISRRKK